MKVVIITEGGQQFGYGHLVRCKALGDAFGTFGCHVTYLLQGDSSINTVFEDAPVERMNWHANNRLLWPYVKGSNSIIIDSYHAISDTYEQLGKRTEVLAFFDDTNRLTYPKGGVLINGILHAEHIPYENQVNVQTLLGLRYQSIRKEFRNQPKKTIHDEIGHILLTTGGNDIRNIIPLLVKACQEVYPASKLDIVTGEATVQQMLNLMQQADLSISAAGQTLCELACCGVPGISVSVIDNQLEHALSWHDEGCFDFAGSWSDRQLETSIKKLLVQYKNKNIRQRKSLKMQSLIDGNGSKRIAEQLMARIMMPLIKQDIEFRQVQFRNFLHLTDAEKHEILGWRNHEQVRSMMLTKDFISYENHLAFLEKLTDANDKVYWVIQYHDRKIGVLDLYDITGVQAYWGYYLNPEYIGSAYGILLEYLVLEIGFTKFHLSSLWCESLQTNKSVIRTHQFFGYTTVEERNGCTIQTINSMMFEKQQRTYELITKKFWEQ